jgi:hypothetical protein
MGQYWKVCNLDKREYVTGPGLGTGAKLWEHLANHPSSGSALIVLCAAMPVARGGGDLRLDSAVARRTIGRWAGDRIALVGDYAEEDDVKGYDVTTIKFSVEDIDGLELDEDNAANEQVAVDMILEAGCPSLKNITKRPPAFLDRLKTLVPNRKRWARLGEVAKARTHAWRDISGDVAAVIAAELDMECVNTEYGARQFKKKTKSA